MVYFDQVSLTNTCQYYLTHGMCNSLFLMDEGFLSIISVCSGQLVKILITIETHGIFGSNFAHLLILTLSSHRYAKWCFELHPINHHCPSWTGSYVTTYELTAPYKWSLHMQTAQVVCCHGQLHPRLVQTNVFQSNPIPSPTPGIPLIIV